MLTTNSVFLLQPDSIVIIAGYGAEYGSGHRSRMEVLQRILHERGIASELFFHPSRNADHLERRYFDGRIPITIEEFLSGFVKNRLCVIDARDFDLGVFQSRPVIAIDNRCDLREHYEEEGNVRFFDSLPHPDASPEEVMRNALISPELVRFRGEIEANPVEALERSLRSVQRLYATPALRSSVSPHFLEQSAGRLGLFSYTGGFGAVEGLDAFLCERRNGGAPFAIRVGQHPCAAEYASCLLRIDSLHREILYRVIHASALTLTHFGMTAMETLFLRRGLVLLSPGEQYGEHRRLSEYFSSLSGVSYVEHPGHFSALSEREGAIAPSSFVPTGEGYGRVVDSIRSMLD